MKSLKLLFVAVLAMVATSVSAQGPQGQQGQRPQRQRMTVEQRTQMQVDRQTKNLDLTEEQQKKLYDYYLGINKKQQEEMEARMKAMREGQQNGQRPDFRNMSEADREKFMKQMQEQRQAQQAAEEKAYKSILTEKQFKKWQMLKKAQEQRMRQMMQERQQGGQGGFGGPGQGGQGGFGGFGNGFGGGAGFRGILGDDEDLLQGVDLCSGLQQGELGNAGLLKACVYHVAHDQAPGVHGGTGGNHLVGVPDDGGGGQIFHFQQGLVAVNVAAARNIFCLPVIILLSKSYTITRPGHILRWESIYLIYCRQSHCVPLGNIPQSLIAVYEMHVKAFGRLLFLRLKIYHCTRPQWSVTLEIVDLQDFLEKESICLGNTLICLTFNGIDKRYTILGIHFPRHLKIEILFPAFSDRLYLLYLEWRFRRHMRRDILFLVTMLS